MTRDEAEQMLATAAVIFKCDEAACKEDPMFHQMFSMDERRQIICAILNVITPPHP